MRREKRKEMNKPKKKHESKTTGTKSTRDGALESAASTAAKKEKWGGKSDSHWN